MSSCHVAGQVDVFFLRIYICSFPREDDHGYFVTMKGIMCYLYNYY
jgi:hypothetical protein